MKGKVMSQEMVASKTFQEKMFERIRDQMGELLSEEDLKSLVDSAMQKAFFEPSYQTDRYGNKQRVDESIFVTLIRNEMTSKVTEAIQKWLAEHGDEVSEAIDNAIAKGMFGLIQQHIELITHQPLQNFADQLRAKGLLGY
jgi:ribosomal protein L21E